MMIKYSPKRKFSKIVIMVLVIILALFILNYFRSGIKNSFYLISSPIQKLFWQMGDSTSGFFTGSSLKKEVLDLRFKNQELLDKISALEQFKKENEDLRNALNLNLRKDFKLVFTQIISKDTSGDYILINKGSEDGISQNMPVIDQNKVLFGRISEIYTNFSRVALITDKNFVSDVKIQEKEIYGVARGQGNLTIFLDLIPRDSELKENDVLVTSNLEGVFPMDLLVGEVKTIKKEDTKSFQTAGVRPFFDLKNTDNLFVITNFKK